MVKAMMMNMGAPSVVIILSIGKNPEPARFAKAVKKTGMKPPDFVWREGGTRVYCGVPIQKMKVAIAIKTPGTAKAQLYP